MGASRCCRRLRWLLLALGLCRGARAQSSPQAELSCLLASGDVLGADDAGPVEPPPWQDLASLRRGDESRARLALSTSQPGFLPGVTTSALLRVELGLNGLGTNTPALRDVSSWLAVSFQLAPRAQVTLRAFPFDTDYVRLGYLHALDWGGTDAARSESIFLRQTGSVPGLQALLAVPRLRLFSALKWANVDDALQGRRRLWGVFSGGSVELGPTLRVDGGFGYFQRPSGAPTPTIASSFVEGASLRVVWHRRVSEPELSAEPFRPPSLVEDPTRFDAEATPGWAVAFEAVTLVQRLRRFENPNRAALVPAPAAAVYGSARESSLAVHAAVTWRSLAFVLRNDARLASGETRPRSAGELAELTAWLGASVTLRPSFLVPSCELGLRLPAAMKTPSALAGFGQTFLAKGSTGLEALPIGAGRLPVASARLGARFQASSHLALSLFGEFARDPNRVRFSALPSGVARAFARAERLALVVAAQARF